MTQYLNIDEFFEESEKLEAEMKANEAIAFAKWLNTPFKRPNGNGSFDIYTRCIPQYPDMTYYIMHDNKGHLNNKVFYKIEELYQIFLKELNEK
jgi:hypothetical protein